MADIFLIALYIIVVKGVGLARVEVAWGLYLFTACVLAAIAFGHLVDKARPAPELSLFRQQHGAVTQHSPFVEPALNELTLCLWRNRRKLAYIGYDLSGGKS